MRLNQITLPASHLDETIHFYELLGLKLIVKTDHYLRFYNPIDFQTLSFELVSSVNNQTIIYFEFDTLDELNNFVNKLSERLIVKQPVLEAWLWYETHVTDPNGNKIKFYYAGENRLNPPWKIETI